MIQNIKGMYKMFLREPLWFKILISSTLIIAIVFSSSFFSDHSYFQSIAKLAAAVFFSSYGIKFRKNTRISLMFFALTVLCIYLAWKYFYSAGLFN